MVVYYYYPREVICIDYYFDSAMEKVTGQAVALWMLLAAIAGIVTFILYRCGKIKASTAITIPILIFFLSFVLTITIIERVPRRKLRYNLELFWTIKSIIAGKTYLIWEIFWSISENIRWGYQERFKRGEYNLGNNRILGYDCVDGKLVPNKDADIIRLIYTLFLQDRNVDEIIRTLTDLGVTSRNGKLLSRSTILYILKNETYKGDKLLQKQPPKNFITKKPDPNAEYESNYLENDHEAIVERDVWDAAAAKLKKNKELTEVVGHRGGQPHFLYGKVFCECGAPMTRRTVNGPGGEKIKTWICREKRNGHGCKGRNVKEEELLKFAGERIVVKDDGLEVG